jgi:hypothetical protein
MKLLDNGRRILSQIAAAALVTLMIAAIAGAKSETSAKDEARLNTEITMLNNDALLPQGEQVVADRMSKTFDVPGDKITSLRDRGLGFGEISAVLAFADKMSGGITDSNVNAVLSLREENPGWAQIAENLKVDLADAAEVVAEIEGDAHQEIKQAAAEGSGSEGRAAGGASRSDDRPVGTEGADL